jgi:hypothetical protein
VPILPNWLIGRTVLLPSDDGEAYRQHLAAYETEFQPVSLRERELVQSLADIPMASATHPCS